MNEEPPELPKTTSRKLLAGLGTVGTIVVIIIAAAIGKTIGRQGVKALMYRSSGTPPTHTFSSASWTPRYLGDISLEAPFYFGSRPDLTANLPAQIRDAFDYFEVFDSGAATDPRASVSRIAYKQGVQVSLDGAVNGAIRQAAAAVGDSNPQFTSTPTTVSGLPGRRATYHGRAPRRPIHIDALFVQHGQKLWQVQVVYTVDSVAADATRLLGSVTITPTQ